MDSRFNPVKKFFSMVGNHAAVYYLLLAAAGFVAFDIPGALRQTNLAVLNRLRPWSFVSLVDGTATGKELDDYVRYYRKVVEVLPEQSDAWGLYAYGTYRQGNVQEAARAYQRAMAIRPDFFWYPYNLGVLALLRGEFHPAVNFFEKALRTTPRGTLEGIVNSPRVYLPLVLLQSPGDVQGFLAGQLRDGYQQAARLLAVSKFFEQNPSARDRAHLPAGLDLQRY
jgi:tetratricopeptide (TPR) repeat protein